MDECTKPLTPPDLRRVAVVGTSCSGKTTFSRRLAAITDATHIEMDALYWLPDWIERPRDEFRSLLATAVAAEHWILDGNYSFARDLVWPRATAIVWLDYPLPLVFGRALRRTIRRTAMREELFSGNRESFRRSFVSRDSILWWVLTTHRRRRLEYQRLTSEQPTNGPVSIVFHNPPEAEAFLAEFEPHPTCSHRVPLSGRPSVE